MTPSTSHAFPVHVRTGWRDFSPALLWYATREVRAVLRPLASHVRSVTVRFSDHEPGGVTSRLCTIEVNLKPNGVAPSAAAAGTEPFELVDRAADEVLARLRAAVGTHRPLR